MSTFDQAIKVSEADGTYSTILDDEWTIGGNPHGGYLLAMLANAAVAADDGRHPHPIAASAIYMSPPHVGDATVAVERLRQGRSASQFRVRLSQDDKIRVESLFTLGFLDRDDQTPQLSWVDAPPVEMAPLDECPRIPIEQPGAGVRVAMLDQVDLRLDPASFDGPKGEPGAPSLTGGSGSLRGWLGFADGTPFDPISLLYAVDAFPPATLTLGSIGWVPTLELTAYVRAVPAPGPVRVRQRVRALTGSVVDQVCEIWDASGQVVAQASQLALVRLASD